MSDTTVSPSVQKKAVKYLTEGKIDVQAVSPKGPALIEARGSEVYEVKWNGGWTCDCPARVLLCAHIVAASLVVQRKATTPQLPTTPDLDLLLGGRQSGDLPDVSELDYLL